MTPIVIAARRYLGSRWVHRGRRMGKVDCVGLVWLAYADCGVLLPCPTDYGREPQHERFNAAIQAALGAPVAGLQVGDVVTMRTSHHPHHIAIVGDHPNGLSLIHASGEHGRTVEHRLDETYRARIVSVYRRAV